MSEDLKRRLHLGDRALCLGAAAKLYSQVLRQKDKISKNEHLGSHSPQIAELKLLWEQCASESYSVALACSEALVALVQHGNADFSYVMRGLLNLVPSAANTAGILDALGQMLLLQMGASLSKHDGNFLCPYGLRSPPHPFISALTSRPDCWPTILQQVSRLLNITDERYSSGMVSMLRPFLSYVLLNPSLPQQYGTLRTTLTDTLLRFIQPGLPEGMTVVSVDVFEFLVDCLCQSQINSLQELSELTSLMGKLTALSPPNNTPAHLRLLTVALTACKECVRLCHDATSCLQIAAGIIESCGSCAVDETIVAVLGWLLLKLPINQHKALLSMIQNVLDLCETEPPVYLPTLRMLILPLLQAISAPVGVVVTMETDERLANQGWASRLLSLVTRLSGRRHRGAVRSQKGVQASTHQNHRNPWYELMQNCGHLARALSDGRSDTCEWLANVRFNVAAGVGTVSGPVMLLVTSLLMGSDVRVVQSSLDVLIQIAGQDSSWAPSLLPLLLFRLGQLGDDEPSLTLALLSALPKTATHKVCITPVFKTLQSIAAREEALLPLVVRLTTELWKLQDRCFPYLHQLLIQPAQQASLQADTINELLLAKVASIREICLLKPHHGEDLLPMLSKILNDCTSPSESSVASLALDAICLLCQAEVIDLCTTWRVLEPKFIRETRPLVLQSICKLLSLTPGVVADTSDNEEFRGSVVEQLWQYSNHGNHNVCAAAFTALANFGEEEFTLDDLPPEVTIEERAKRDVNKAKRAANRAKLELSTAKHKGTIVSKEDDDDDDEEEAVPPLCYLKLLMYVKEEVLPAYQVFWSSLLLDEVKDLPRGVYKAAMKRQQQPAGQGRALENVPVLLLNRFERVKQPGLKPGLAVALLCCFEPRRESGRHDNRTAKRYIINKGRAYQHMIGTLLNEVSVLPCDWFLRLQTPHAWRLLMHNAFHSLIQSRHAELELQTKIGHLDGYQCEVQGRSAWLWVRDRLADQLKTSAKANVSSCCNSILALAGLALVSTQHAMTLTDDEDQEPDQSQQHSGQNHWLGVVVDTLLCLVDTSHQAKGKIFTWYQQLCRGLDAPPQPSSTARGIGALALALLAPLFLTTNTSLVTCIIDALTGGLPTRQSRRTVHWSPDEQIHGGIAVGMLIAKLHEERYIDYLGTEGEVTMIRVLDVLEASCLSTEDKIIAHGSLLGLAMALSAMSREGTAYVRTHVAKMHGRLKERLEVEEGRSEDITVYFEALCMCLGCVTAASFSSNIISPAEAFNVAVKLQTLCQQRDQNAGLAVSVGVLFHSLVTCSHPSINPLVENIYATWSSILVSQTSTLLQVVAALRGLVSLVTGAALMVTISSEAQSTSDLRNKQTSVLKQISQMLTDWANPAVQNTVSWLLGYIHMITANAGSQSNTTGVPSSYSYLPETSLLRASIDHLVSACKLGPEVVSPRRLETLLSPLAGREYRLPPLNWTAVLSPLLRLPFGEGVHSLCLNVALAQSSSQPSAAMCVAAWLSPPIFTTLKASCQSVLFGALPILAKSLSATKLKLFVESALRKPFRACGSAHALPHCEAIVEGLLGALKVPDPPAGAVLILQGAVRDVYGLMPSSPQLVHGRIMATLAQCLCYLPGEDIDAVTSPLKQDNLVKCTHVRSYIVCQGGQSLMWLNACVDVAMNLADDRQHASLVHTLLAAFMQCNVSPSEHIGLTPRLHWLLELMGHASNIARGKTQLAPNRPISKVMHFLLDVFTSAIIAWSPTDLPLMLAVVPSWLQVSPRDATAQGRACDSYLNRGLGTADRISAVTDILKLLPCCLPSLLKIDPWAQITEKILDWLLGLLEVPEGALSTKAREHLKAAILSLGHTPAFKRPTCWTRVHSSRSTKVIARRDVQTESGGVI